MGAARARPPAKLEAGTRAHLPLGKLCFPNGKWAAEFWRLTGAKIRAPPPYKVKNYTLRLWERHYAALKAA